MPSLRTRLIVTSLAVTSLGAGLLLANPASALAAAQRPERTQSAQRPERAPLDLEQLRSKCLEAIEVRLTVLETATGKLGEAKHVTDEHEAALVAILADTSASLTSLAGEIRADTDLGALRVHCRSVFLDHRVFALVLPRTRLVVGSDAAHAAAAKLTQSSGRIEAGIAKVEANGGDVTQAKADLEAMRAEIASGDESAAPVPGQVMGLTPADWNADHEVLTPARQHLRSARVDLGEARDLGRKIIASLRGGRAPSPDHNV